MTTTVSYLAGANKSGPVDFVDNTQVLSRYIDFQRKPVTADTIMQILTIPKGFVIESSFIVLHTKEGATCTFDLGDDDSATTFKSNFNANTGTVPVVDFTPALATLTTQTGKAYTAAQTLVLHADSATSFAQMTVGIKGWFVPGLVN